MGSMNTFPVVVGDLPMHSLDELPDMIEPFDVAELQLKIRVERFLDAVLPGARFAAVRRL